MIDKVIDSIIEKHLIKRYGLLVLALFVSSIAYNLLVYPAKIVAGGVNGLSIIAESSFSISPSIFILIVNTSILIITLLTLGFEKSSGSIVATFVYPLFVDLTSGISTIVSIDNKDMLLISLFIGLISGWVSGTIYKMGFSGGGISSISQILFEKIHVAVSKTSFVINTIIVILGGIYFGFENIMYATIVLFVSSVVMDRVLLGISKNKTFYVITNKEKEVREFILNELEHGVTELKVINGYTNKKGTMIMTVIPTKEYFKVSEGIKRIDKDAFFIVTDSYEMLNAA